MLADRTKKLASGTRGGIYKEALKIQAQGEKVLKINTGNPAAFGFPMPESLKKAIKDAGDKIAAYTESCGIDEAREAILNYHLGKGLEGIAKEDIFLGNGVSELAELVCSAFLNPGDEILCPCPNYNLWTNSAIMAGGKPVFYMCHEENAWMPDAKEIESLVTEKTKALVIINPNNPTGALYSDQLLSEIADVCKRHNIVIFADEIYDRLIMDGRVHTAMGKIAKGQPVITFNGLSKSHIICGIRCAWLVLSGFGENTTAVRTTIDTYCSIRLCANAVGQYCVKAALEDPAYTVEMMSPGGMVYERREACIDEVNKSKYLSVIKNTGALYCFVRIDPDKVHIDDAKVFFTELIKAKHVMVVPGTGFDFPKQNYFRIVMLPDPETLRDAVRKIDEFCGEWAAK